MFCFSLEFNSNEARHKQKNSEYLLQFGLPTLLMPSILLGSLLPFLLPPFTMATIMASMLNNGALLGAIMYAAKSAAQNNEHKIYYNPSYN